MAAHVPMIRSLRSGKPPWEVYRSVYASSAVCFFLDSHRYRFPNQTHSYIGMDPFLEVTVEKGKIRVSGECAFTAPADRINRVLRMLLKRYRPSGCRRRDFFQGGAVGYWGYELAPLFDKVRLRAKRAAGYPDLYLGFFRDVIVYDHRRKKYFLVTHPENRGKADFREARKKAEARILRMKAFFRPEKRERPESFRLESFRPDIPRARFESMVARAKGHIAAGDIYQANLSQRFSFRFKGSTLRLYGALRKINPSPFACHFKIRALEIISCSPERLVRKRGRLCETLPIAGTRPRRAHARTSRQLARDLLASEKERAEHIMLVDLERNDLGRVCDYRSVRVARMMRIEKYSHVIHIVSKITGKLRAGRDALDLVRAMFPGGTITGCPKIRCMEIIDRLEPSARGIYTGSVGYIDFFGDADLNIAIRTMVVRGGKGYFQVGAGIVHDSNPAREFEETLHKGEALAEALVRSSL